MASYSTYNFGRAQKRLIQTSFGLNREMKKKMKCVFSDIGPQTFLVASLDKSSQRKKTFLEPENFYFSRKNFAKLADTEKKGHFLGLYKFFKLSENDFLDRQHFGKQNCSPKKTIVDFTFKIP